MKRTITLLAIIFAFLGTLQAQSQYWWGYMNDDNNNQLIGVGKAATYYGAIFVPGNHDVTAGKTINAVRFGLLAPHASDVKVWIASSLPKGTLSESNTLWMTNVKTVEKDNFTDVPLATPYAIPAEGVYVGYTFTITSATTQNDQYPLLVGGTDQVGGLLLRTNSGAWADYCGQGFGVLAMKVLLEGKFSEYVVSPAAAQNTYYAEVGKSADVDIILTNNGSADVNSIAYTLTANGVTGEEQTVQLPAPLAIFKNATVTINVAAGDKADNVAQSVTITKVNGEANQSSNATAQFVLSILNRLIPRNVVVEEFTGTGCGWCPRGLVGMEKLRQTFGDRFIGIGIHQYNESDAMYIANYSNLKFRGAPSCRINRGADMDPFYGTGNDVCDDFRMEMSVPAMVDVDVMGIVNNDMTEVEATAFIEPMFDTSDYTLELAVVADGLSGTTTAWQQANYYCNQQASSQPEELRIFCSGGKYGSSSVKGFVFNDVAVGSSYKNGVNQMEALGSMTGGETRKVSYTLTLPTKATLRNALKNGTIYVVALVVNKDGTIANAAKHKVGDTEGVGTIDTDPCASAPVRYSLNGTQIATPQRGINIVRMSDGTVRKVLVK